MTRCFSNPPRQDPATSNAPTVQLAEQTGATDGSDRFLIARAMAGVDFFQN